MKKITLFLILFCILKCVCAQNYHPMLGNSNLWLFPDDYQIIDTIRTMGDTLIGSNTYQKLYPISEWTKTKYAFIREDTLQKKIYLIQRDSTHEILLYDFNLMPGDSIYLNFIDYVSFDSSWFFLDSITSETTLSGVRNAFYLHSRGSNQNGFCFFPSELKWIEGVGSLYGPTYIDEWYNDFPFLLLCPNHICIPDIYPLLSCHYKDSILDFSSDCFLPNCSIWLDDNKHLDNTNLKIYPNPNSGKLQIEIPTSIFGDQLLIRIYNTMAILVKEDLSKNNDTFILDISSFEGGLYIVELSINRILISRNKIVLIK